MDQCLVPLIWVQGYKSRSGPQIHVCVLHVGFYHMSQQLIEPVGVVKDDRQRCVIIHSEEPGEN